MIIGREKERRELLGLLEKEESQFCAVYGRWRFFRNMFLGETTPLRICELHLDWKPSSEEQSRHSQVQILPLDCQRSAKTALWKKSSYYK